VYVDALPESDFTAKALLENLPPGQDIFYRISFQDLSSAVFGEAQIGHFRTPSNEPRPVSFLWSGDTMGQGWGIDTARGGMRTYDTMLRNRPDFFIHCGDNIYADCPIAAELKLPDGGVWRSIVTEEKSKQAETLAEYRGNYNTIARRQSARFQRGGAHIRAVGQSRSDGDMVARRRLAARADRREEPLVFAARARRAFHEFLPVRETMAEPAGSIARSNMARCSTCSCSICAATAAQTARIPIAFSSPTIICSARSGRLAQA